MGYNGLTVLPPTPVRQAGGGRLTHLAASPPRLPLMSALSFGRQPSPHRLCLRLSLPPSRSLSTGGAHWLRLPPSSAAVPACGSEEEALDPKMCPLGPSSPPPPGLGRQRLPLPAVQLGSEQSALIPPVGPTSMPMREAGWDGGYAPGSRESWNLGAARIPGDGVCTARQRASQQLWSGVPLDQEWGLVVGDGRLLNVWRAQLWRPESME